MVKLGKKSPYVTSIPKSYNCGYCRPTYVVINNNVSPVTTTTTTTTAPPTTTTTTTAPPTTTTTAPPTTTTTTTAPPTTIGPNLSVIDPRSSSFMYVGNTPISNVLYGLVSLISSRVIAPAPLAYASDNNLLEGSVPLNDITITSPTTIEFQIKGLYPGVTKNISIKCLYSVVNEFGYKDIIEGPESNYVVVSPYIDLPSPPQNIIAFVDDSHTLLNVSFIPSYNASNNYITDYHYNIHVDGVDPDVSGNFYNLELNSNSFMSFDISYNSYPDIRFDITLSTIESIPQTNTISAVIINGDSTLDPEIYNNCNFVICDTVINSIYINDFSNNIGVSFSNITSISDSAFQNCYQLTYIDFANITNIGNYAFQDCSNLSYAINGDSVESIGSNAFENSSVLNHIRFPNAITVGPVAFSGSGIHFADTQMVTDYQYMSFSQADNLQAMPSLKIANTIGMDAFSGSMKMAVSLNLKSDINIGERSLNGSGIIAVKLNQATSVQNREFTNQFTEESVNNILPMNNILPFAVVNTIDSYAFNNCGNLLTAILDQATFTETSSHSFDGCVNLQNVTLPTTCTTIGAYTFYNCSSLTTIDMSSVQIIEDSAFYQCTGLNSVINTDNVTSIGVGVFYGCTDLTDISFNNPGLTSIGLAGYPLGFTFAGCTNLVSVGIPSSVATITSSAFENCTSLTNIDLSNVISFGEDFTSSAGNTFYGCTSLTSVNISSITQIASSSFQGCTSLSSITIPSSLTTIGNGAFYDCSGLITIDIQSTIQQNGNVFNASTLTNVETITTYYSSWFTGSSFTGLKLKSFTLIGPQTNSPDFLVSAATLESVDMSNVTTITPYAFFECIGLSSINIPSVITIGDNAFYDCSGLTTIDLPSVTTIGLYAFYNCRSLQSIIFGQNLATIGSGILALCSSLTAISVPASFLNAQISGASYNPGDTIDNQDQPNYDNILSLFGITAGQVLTITCT